MRGLQNYFFDRKKIINIWLSLIIILLILCSGLNIFSNHNNSSDEFIGIASGSRAYSFDIEFDDSEFIVEPKTETFIDLFLVNTGDAKDTYTLTFTSIPTDWTAKFYHNGAFKEVLSLEVGTIEYPNIDVYITAPQNGGGILRVSCSSQFGQEIKTAQINLDAKYIITFNLLDKSHEHSVYAGDSTSFEIELKNHQDDQDEISLTFSGKDIKIQKFADDFEWAVSFDNMSIILAPDESKSVILTVFAPRSGEPGNQINIIAIAKSQTVGQDFRFPELIVRIPKIYNVTYSLKLLTPSSQNFPNSTVNYTLKLFNEGNVDLTISLRLQENSENWGIFFFLNNDLKTPENLALNIGKVLEFRVQVEIPKTAKAGVHKIVYGVTRKEVPETPLTMVNILTNVSLVSDLNIVLSQDIIPVDLSKITTTIIEIHNKGNGKDTLNISIIKDTIPAKWTIYFASVKNVKNEINTTENVNFYEPVKIIYYEPTEYKPNINANYASMALVIDANKKAYLTLAISTPNTGLPTTEKIKIYGVSESGTIATVTKDLSLNLVVSDLKIMDINITPNNPSPGDNVKVKVEVTNNFHLTANDFTVRISKLTLTEGKGTELGAKLVESLGAGESTTVEFSWTDPEEIEGSYILEVQITGNIIPTNKVPNKRKTVILSEPKEEKENGNDLNSIILFLVMAIVIAIIIFLIIWLIFSRRAPVAEDQEDGEQTAGGGKVKDAEKDKRVKKPEMRSSTRTGSDKFKYEPSTKKTTKINDSDNIANQIKKSKSKSNTGQKKKY